ncbi:MAG TPA: RimK family alpha-L-glutamate ligase [Candidatus Saccharimonadales bacterium]|nr:RimK family alpha-L-glutamate ligase [Candidatus Saccharimonadales bacterium]
MTTKELTVIGRAENLELLDLGVSEVTAKVDTGADVSSIWASSIEEKEDGLYFILFGPGSPFYSGKLLRFTKPDYTMTRVANSFGQKELRYKVGLRIKIKDRIIRATFTLSDRSQKIYPILIGRRLLHGKFLVDVTGGNPMRDAEEAKATQLERDLHKISATKTSGLRIAILSKGPGNYSTKRLKEEAERHGHAVRILNYAKCYVTLESNKPVVRYDGEELHDVDVIIPRIAANLTGYGAAIVRQFEMQNVFTTTTSIALVRSRDKLRSTQLLAKAGVGIPKTVFGRETADLDDILDQVGGAPVIIKVARGTHGNGVVLAETKKAAKAVMQAFYVEGVSFIVQEFVAESAGTDIRAFVVNGKVVASMQRQSLDDDFRSNLHQGGQGSTVRLTDEERKTAQKAAKAMGLPICGVDMMRSDRGPLVLEVNSSPGFGIEKVTGHNVAERIIEYVEQHAKSGRRKDKVGA